MNTSPPQEDYIDEPTETVFKPADLEELFTSQLPEAKVMVVGDLVLDKYVFGRADRLSPESPVPVLTVDRETYRLGAAANTVSNLSGLGLTPLVAGLIGSDDDAETLRSMLNNIVKDDKGLVTDSSRPTTKKTRFMSRHTQLLRVDQESCAPIPVHMEEKLYEYVERHIRKLDLLILSDYGKGMFNRTFAAQLIKLAKRHNVAVLVDPKGKDYDRYQGATLLTPNLHELSTALDIPLPETDKEVIEAGRTLARHADAEAILVTRSQDGMTLVPREGNSYGLDHPYHFKARVVDVFDVSGAGDTVIAVLGACLACGMILSEAVQIANAAAGLVVQKVGTASIQAGELRAALSSNSNMSFRRDIYGVDNWAGALQVVEQWKAQGLAIGFTNGCFDILHAGHVTYLNEARQKCDKLIVGLNVDNSVSRLKGDSRPVNDQQDRASVLAALKSVDMVVLFGKTEAEDDKAIEIIGFLKPDIYFKGGDYNEEDIAEVPTVRTYGGEIFICRPMEGKSTTLTIEKLKNKTIAA